MFGWGESRFNCWGVRELALVLFLFYVNVFGMCPLSLLSSQALTIPASWVLHVGWSIPVVSTLGDCLPFPCEE